MDETITWTCTFCGREHDDDPGYCPSDDCPSVGLDVRVDRIGKLNITEASVDEYVLLRGRDTDLTAAQAHQWLYPRAYRDCGLAGGYFCTSVTCIEQSPNRIVAVIHHRWDV